jgi:hypothetical protein
VLIIVDYFKELISNARQGEFFIKLCSPTVDIPSRVYLIKTCDTISVEVVDQGLRVSPERGV